MVDTNKKAWGGRFTSDTNKEVERLNASLPFDRILFEEDILGSAAHARMLNKIGIISDGELKTILPALHLLLRSFRLTPPEVDLSKEDIHMYVESSLRKIIGPLAGKIHTARSRNDQIALDMRLFCRKKILLLTRLLNNLRSCFLEVARKHTDTILPGYTHLQRAQPVSFAFHLTCYAEMFDRDISRLQDALARVNILPLGAGAMAGTTFPIDRKLVADLLNFSDIYLNSMDAVSDRDYVVELLHIGSLIMIHLSRFCEECILWSSTEFMFIEFDDAFCTGSSIMPQKKNPDVAELLRGKTGRVVGALNGILTVLKSLPLAYNKDLQEDKEGLFDALNTLEDALSILPEMLKTMKVNTDVMKKAVESDFSNATDLADYLVNKGIPFRDCHEIAGKVVRHCIDNKTTLLTLPLEDYQSFAACIKEDIFDHIKPATVVAKRESQGGTGTNSVVTQLERVDQKIISTRDWIKAMESTLELDENRLFSLELADA